MALEDDPINSLFPLVPLFLSGKVSGLRYFPSFLLQLIRVMQMIYLGFTKNPAIIIPACSDKNMTPFKRLKDPTRNRH